MAFRDDRYLVEVLERFPRRQCGRTKRAPGAHVRNFDDVVLQTLDPNEVPIVEI